MDCEKCKGHGFLWFERRFGNRKYRFGEDYKIACPKCEKGKLFYNGREGALGKIRLTEEILENRSKVSAFYAQDWDWPRNPKEFEAALDNNRLFMRLEDSWFRARRVKPTREALPWVCYITVGFGPSKPVIRLWLRSTLFRIEGTRAQGWADPERALEKGRPVERAFRIKPVKFNIIEDEEESKQDD